MKNIVKIKGGLGNQLFQYAFGIYIGRKKGVEIGYDCQTQSDSALYLSRELDIEKIGISLPKVPPPGNLPKGFFRKAATAIKSLGGGFFLSINPHQPASEAMGIAYYEGYWQTVTYAQEALELYREKFESIIQGNPSLLKWRDTVKQKNAVAVHIRRSDYITIPTNHKLFHVCEMDYYQKAIEKIEKDTENPVFYIFSQDSDWVKENFNPEKFIFVQGGSALEDMIMMSLCNHNIIANSTFSWWSAFLNKNNNKIVISPRRWYKKKNQYFNEFIPKAWIQL